MPDSAPGPVLCFGESLWDCLPQGRFPGGAPMNVAYHLRQLGLRALPVTAVGRDRLGEELLRRMQDLGLETDFVSVLPDKPTGTAHVTLEGGVPGYQIPGDAAWDWIELHPALLALAPRASALVFGSLAQRGAHNRLRLAALREHCGVAMQVFDVNLRAPFDAPDRVEELANGVDLVKLNREEIARLLSLPFDSLHVEEAARRLALRTGCGSVCVTAGALGAGWLHGGEWFWSAAEVVEVRDAVGAGDAFLAMLLHGLLASRSAPGQILRQACRLAGFVASRDGATPSYPADGRGPWAAP